MGPQAPPARRYASEFETRFAPRGALLWTTGTNRGGSEFNRCISTKVGQFSTGVDIQAVFKRLVPQMRCSITFDKGTEFAQHALLRGMLSATTHLCDAYASWQKGSIENANGRIRRWLHRSTDLDELTDQDIQGIAMTINLTPRKWRGYRTPVEAFLFEFGRDIKIRFT